MPLKQWTVHEPVNSNDLNANFVSLDLRTQTLEQAVAAGGGGSISSPTFDADGPTAFTFDAD